LAEPISLPIEDQGFDRCASAISENEDRAAERILRELDTTKASEPVDSLSKIGGFDCDEDPHLRRDLNHRSSRRRSRRKFARALESAPESWTRIFVPEALSISTTL